MQQLVQAAPASNLRGRPFPQPIPLEWGKDSEIATLNCVYWFNQYGVMESLGCIPSAGSEANN